MDWTKYSNIHEYVKKLPESSHYEQTISKFEQAIKYPSQPVPIRPCAKLPLSFQNTNSTYCYTDRLWQYVLLQIDETNGLFNHSLKQCYIHFFKKALKDFIMDRPLMKFLTSRRAYAILELLDKPKVLIERKHITALGYFLSFLLNKQISIHEEQFEWTRDLEKSNVHVTLYPQYNKEKN